MPKKKPKTNPVNRVVSDIWNDTRKGLVQPAIEGLRKILAPIASKAVDHLVITIVGGVVLGATATVGGLEATGQISVVPIVGPERLVVLPRSLGVDCSGRTHPSALFQNIGVTRGASIPIPFRIVAIPPWKIHVGGEFLIDGLEAPNFAMRDSEFEDFNVFNIDTDGWAITPNTSTTTEPANSVVQGGPLVFGDPLSPTTVDELYLLATTADCIITGDLIVQDVTISGGDVSIEEIRGNQFTMSNGSIGDLDGSGIPDLDVDSSVIIGGSLTVFGVDAFAGVDNR